MKPTQLPFFFEEYLPDTDEFYLSEASSRHIAQVLRMKEGDLLKLTNGQGYLLTVQIIQAHKKQTLVKISDRKKIDPAGSITAIAVSFVKNTGRFEWFLEKATEIGITRIIPLICTRTEKTHFRNERMRTILISAMLQSQQVWLPELLEPLPFAKLFNNVSFEHKFIAHCIEEKKKTLQDAVDKKSGSKIILIGPEGDFTPEEIDIALAHDFIPVSLGQNRLRTETAAIVAAVLLKSR